MDLANKVKNVFGLIYLMTLNSVVIKLTSILLVNFSKFENLFGQNDYKSILINMFSSKFFLIFAKSIKL